jgi:predicted esterase
MSADKRRPIIIFLSLLAISHGSIYASDGADDAPRTGTFSIEATPREIVGPERAENFASVVSLDEPVTWQLTVPESYETENPPGVLVYISPSNSGKIPRGWQELPEAHNLIWIAADHSGNRINVAHRMTYSIFAILLIGDRYAIDSSRIYLSGFSGGARVAGLVAAAYPQVFRGDIYIGGAETWEGELAADKLEAMKRNRYVFLAGSDDFNRRMVRKVAAAYKVAGIKHVEQMTIAHMGHELPSGSTMSDALNFLDGNSPR